MSERIRWDDEYQSHEHATSVGYAGPSGWNWCPFAIYKELEPGSSDHFLVSELPGQDRRRHLGTPDELKAEAERWLEEFVSSLGAIFMDERRQREIGWRINQVIGWAKDGRRGDEYAMDVEKVDRMRDDILSYAFADPGDRYYSSERGRSVSYSREQFDRIKAAAESYGYTVVSRWRPGLKTIRLGDIVLSESGPDDEPSPVAGREED